MYRLSGGKKGKVEIDINELKRLKSQARRWRFSQQEGYFTIAGEGNWPWQVGIIRHVRHADGSLIPLPQLQCVLGAGPTLDHAIYAAMCKVDFK